ncbi:glycosyltransferase family 2 protein [Stagnimonas aquatica]|uniref:Glycosyltransferase family 2 protein n=1 Tax=Stagnimonas aquatica TaxID=2689987 RepID=A0A3N0V8U5_9GAMM|nr:glycosyltransferase family 2 protein [Stagnimonas aquatica]ROH89149.1 glycosyltransferase family 2 protein [Stagnimonas aquatica]
MRISFLINNFNYGRYVGRAIESVLAQDHPDCEVIVVDDGSTDESVDVIRGYGERIQTCFKPNGGQASAYNEGFRRSSGDLVVFLDSDDVLYPGLATELCRCWRPGISKIQYRLRLIDAEDRPLGGFTPGYLFSGDLRGVVSAFGDYGSAPGSGNAYARDFLNKIMPLPEARWRIGADNLPIMLAPFHGRIGVLPGDGVGGGYRLHATVGGAVNNTLADLAALVRRSLEFRADMRMELQARGCLSQQTDWLTPPHTLKKLILQEMAPGDLADPGLRRRWALAKHATRSIHLWPARGRLRKAVYWIWVIGMLCLPRAWAWNLGRKSFSPRVLLPRWLQRRLSGGS